MKNVKKYTKQFKIDAVKLVTEHGLKLKLVSERLDIQLQTLYRWIDEYSQYGDEAFCGQGKELTMEAKLRRKDKEIADLKEELDILKKAAAYFAKKREQK